jgi:glutathione S-transferase
MSYTVHGSISSPFFRKICCVFGEKGVAFTLRQLDVFNAPPEFSKISPLRRIPILAFDDFPDRPPLPDSSAICAYLEAAYPDPPLLEPDPYLRGRALWIEEYADTNLAYRIGFSVTRPILHPGDAPIDYARIDEEIRAKVQPLLAYLEGEIAGRTWFVEDRFGLADIAVSAQLVGLHHSGKRDALDPFPGLQAFLDRALERPVFGAMAAREAAALAERAAARAA